MSNGGYIKLHRKILEWEWWDDPNTFRLFIFLLLSVNWEPKSWHGREILPGQKVTSREKLAEETGLTISQVRTSLNKLKSTNEIAIETTSSFTLVTIIKWASYQSNEEETASKFANKISNESPANRQQIASESPLLKKEKKERTKEEKKGIYGEFSNVHLTSEEYCKLGPDVDAMIERLSAYKASTGKKYPNDYATILNWQRRDAGSARPTSTGNRQTNQTAVFADLADRLARGEEI